MINFDLKIYKCGQAGSVENSGTGAKQELLAVVARK
jgi:hypothetical protein